MRQLWRNERGVAGIEFALCVPFLIVGVFGTYEAGRFMRAVARVDDAAGMLADIVAQQTIVTATTMANFCSGAMLSMTPLQTASLQAAVASVTYSTTTSSRIQDWQDTTCGTATAMTSPASLATMVLLNSGDSAIVVTATYSYSLSISTVLARSFTITRVALARPRAGTAVKHS